MKKLSLVLALVLAMGTFASCSGETATTTAAGDDAPATTTAATTTAAKITIPNLVTDAPTTTEDPDAPIYADDIEVFPNAYWGDLALEGYEVAGYFENGEDIDGSDGGHAMFLFTNDSMAAGKLTATFTGVEGSPSDSGIIFCMEEDIDELTWFWENGPAYYMLFVADAGTLYLSKVSYQGVAWTICQITADPIPGFVHGQEITITAEFDGAGHIKGYANGELLIDYTDPSPLTGSGYGVRAEIIGVTYSSVIAEHD